MKSNILLMEEKNGWSVFSLKYGNIVSQGDSKKEAIKNICLIMEDVIEHNEAELFEDGVDPVESIKSATKGVQYRRLIIEEVNIKEDSQIEIDGRDKLWDKE